MHDCLVLVASLATVGHGVLAHPKMLAQLVAHCSSSSLLGSYPLSKPGSPPPLLYHALASNRANAIHQAQPLTVFSNSLLTIYPRA